MFVESQVTSNEALVCTNTHVVMRRGGWMTGKAFGLEV